MNSCQSHKFYKFCTFSAIKAYVTRRSTNMIITTVIHTVSAGPSDFLFLGADYK